MFRDIFKEPVELAGLYHAITGEKVDKPGDILLNTLDSVLVNRLRNDLSFCVGDRLTILLEAQSTPNANMPLRMYLYSALLYNQTVPLEVRYKRKPYLLPRPQFYVLYDGCELLPEQFEQHMSDLYKIPMNAGAPSMELTVHWFNISDPRAAICRRFATLQQYSQFIAIREYYEQTLPESEDKQQEVLRLTIKECIKKNILRQYLQQHQEEVFDMFNTEWDNDMAIKVAAEEAAEDAVEKTYIQMALDMLRDNESLHKIVRYSHLTADVIRQLAAQHGLNVVEG